MLAYWNHKKFALGNRGLKSHFAKTLRMHHSDVFCQSAIGILAWISEMNDISEPSQGCHNGR